MNINDCLEQMSAIYHKLGAIESQQKSLLLEVKRLCEELKRIQYDDPDWSNTALRWKEAAQEKDVFYDGDGKIIVTVADCQPDSQFCELDHQFCKVCQKDTEHLDTEFKGTSKVCIPCISKANV